MTQLYAGKGPLGDGAMRVRFYDTLHDIELYALWGQYVIYIVVFSDIYMTHNFMWARNVRDGLMGALCAV